MVRKYIRRIPGFLEMISANSRYQAVSLLSRSLGGYKVKLPTHFHHSDIILLTCVAKYRIEPSHVDFNHFNTLQKPVNIKASASLIIHIWSNTSVTCVLLTVKHNFQKCVKPDI